MAIWRRRVGQETSSGVLTKAALEYWRLGWSVIPIEHRGQRPLLPWQVYQHRRPSPPEIAEWFRQWPTANIAVVTGVVSGIVVLELDPRHGGDDQLARLEQAHGRLVNTVEAHTGGGGRHLYFAHPGKMMRNQVGLAPGIDLRGDGGYVVAPPSVDAGGEPFRWERSAEVCPLERLPDWVRALAAPGGRQGQPVSHWHNLLREGVPEGKRTQAIASLARHLLHHEVDHEIATELLLSWNATCCRPPLAAEEVVQTVQSMTRRHQGEGGEGDGEP